jgi:S1-C subfamily serine protease
MTNPQPGDEQSTPSQHPPTDGTHSTANPNAGESAPWSGPVADESYGTAQYPPYAGYQAPYPPYVGYQAPHPPYAGAAQGPYLPYARHESAYAPYGSPQTGPEGGYPPPANGPYWAPTAGIPTPPPGKPARRRPKGRLLIAGAAVATAGAVGIAAAVGAFGSNGSSVLATTADGNGSSNGSNGSSGSSGSGGSSGNGFGGYGNGGSNGFGFGGGGFGSGGSGSSGGSGGSTSSATSAQQVGVVDIDTVLGYQSARAAGTGMVLTSNGEVLTNNHVVRDATKITVTVVSTGKSYAATVVGTDATDDVAVLQLTDASGLATIKTADSSTVKVGDAVTGVGNAGGVGGTPSAAAGTVTGLNQTITASDDNGSNPETLTGMIETNAAIEAGDSGGPLYNSANQVVGIDSAASGSQVANDAYAVPINKALSIASQIESGQSSSTIHIGATPFLGVEMASSAAQRSNGSSGNGLGNGFSGNGFSGNGSSGNGSSGNGTASGASIAGVVADSPAARAGLAADDTITMLGGTSISSADDLSQAISQHKVGDSVAVGWTDSSGQSHTATVTLIAGPAD